MPEFSGAPAGGGRRFAVVASRFNEHITQKLVDGALDALLRHGAVYEDVDVVWVPGAWELPAAARHLLASERYDALVAVGAVIRGDTPHFDYVAGEASRGLAEARAGGAHGNKGRDAAMAALEMADLFARLDAASDAGEDEEADGAFDD